MHHRGVTLARVKVWWADHPAMECASWSHLNVKELLVVVVISLELSNQLGVVFECTDHLALLGRADCCDGRRLSIAIAIDEVAIVLREASAIDASLSR